MKLPSLLAVVAFTSSLASAALVSDKLVQPRQDIGIDLLRLIGVLDMAGATFTGVGIPCQCQNLPENINAFSRAEVTPGFRCAVYTQPDCSGSRVTVDGPTTESNPNTIAALTWKSWRCSCTCSA